jgi:ABC-type Fe3+/spermidine/putrescine transport system ATPase subunit
MRHGRVIADGRPEHLFAAPTSEFVARFFAGMNVLRSEALGPIADRGKSPTDGHVGFAPSRLAFEPPTDESVSIAATVVDRLFLGDKIQILLSCPHLGQNIVAHVTQMPETATAPGAPVTAYIRMADLIPLAD